MMKFEASNAGHDKAWLEDECDRLVVEAPDGRRYAIRLAGNALRVSSADAESIIVEPRASNCVHIYTFDATTEPTAFVQGKGFVGTGASEREREVAAAREVRKSRRRR